ncbi:MAG: hypothetical protein ACREPV_00440 [Lysobacter sp.]
MAALLNRVDAASTARFGELFRRNGTICRAARETPIDSATVIAFSIVYAT